MWICIWLTLFIFTVQPSVLFMFVCMKSLCFAIICHLSHSFFFFNDVHWQTRRQVGSLFGFLEETCSVEMVQVVRCACVWTLGLFPAVWLSWMARSESDADFFHRHELHPSIQFLCTRFILSLIQQYRHLLLMSFGYVCMMWLEICESYNQQWIACKLLVIIWQLPWDECQ